MGYFIRFIHNRDLAAENIMTAYCRSSLIRDCYPGAVQALLAKLKRAGYALPKRSMLTLAGELILLRGDLPGEFGMSLTKSRRHGKLIRASPGLLRDVKSLLRRGRANVLSDTCEARLTGNFSLYTSIYAWIWTFYLYIPVFVLYPILCA